MNKDEKRLMLFDMQEHPDKYTDEQIERLFADEEVKEFLRDLAMARMAGKKATPKKVDVDKAWKEFSNGSYRNRMKIAASIVGVIFISGVALAAVQNGWFKFSTSDKAVENKAATEQIANSKQLANDSLKAITTDPKDSLDMKPVVFDDAELGTVLMQMADFYHVKVEYMNVNTQHVRLFFNWNKTKTLEQNMELLNAFDRIQIEYVEGILIVK
ncbi:DUF4974 domain-containing protein [uncultured Prevotella sp.]|uniref:DUF4974 domain-containing protein n=1 Tax=uncultured Prevotella sp. TaxID=159272 RepID=UPI0027E2AE47|nr:DUF4974 domain-containing protein [uncultured Prevotella sp.]